MIPNPITGKPDEWDEWDEQEELSRQEQAKIAYLERHIEQLEEKVAELLRRLDQDGAVGGG